MVTWTLTTNFELKKTALTFFNIDAVLFNIRVAMFCKLRVKFDMFKFGQQFEINLFSAIITDNSWFSW